MRGRTVVWWTLGLAFAITLAVVVGQRLSAQAMAVVIGIIAGVAASIPTSLLVVWVTSRLTLPRAAFEAPLRAEPRERQIVVMQAPPAPAYAGPNGYAAPAGGGGYAQAAYPANGYGGQPALPPRRFTVVGGGYAGGYADGRADGRALAGDEDEGFEEDGAWTQ